MTCHPRESEQLNVTGTSEWQTRHWSEASDLPKLRFYATSHVSHASNASQLEHMVATQEYLDAVAPLLARSPRLVTSLVAWVARLLKWYDLCWPTSRLLLLAAREPREKSQLPSYSLGRLPSEVIKGHLAQRGHWSWMELSLLNI